MDHKFLEIGLAFFEGLALIVSPCIWPILPLVLSASVSGGKKRPFGVILGFITSFALIAWASRWLIAATGLNLDYIKYGSLVLLALFGVVLLSSKLSDKFGEATQGFANIGAKVSVSEEGGFFSGLMVGVLVGLVWTPCAGPILATVLVQIIRESSDLFSLYILFSFALGVGVPMGVIALTGRAAMSKMGFVRTHAQTLRHVFGVLILLSVVYLASGVDLPTLVQQHFAAQNPPVTDNKPPLVETAEQQQTLIDALPQPYPAPPLIAGGEWINSSPLTMESLKGKVVLVDFWTYSCINCLRTLPYVTGWDRKYRDSGLVIIGVHAPEFGFEKNLANVRDAVARYGIAYPVMQDNDLQTWGKFNNRYWPAQYLINREGQVVYTHFGEGADDVTEHNIRALLGSVKEPVVSAPNVSAETMHDEGQTQETYLGTGRGERLANEGTAPYIFPAALGVHQWALQGNWRREAEKIVTTKAGDSLRLHFKAKKLFLVLGTATGQPLSLSLTLNGASLGTSAGADVSSDSVTVTGNRLYALVTQNEFKDGLLEINADAPGLEAYAFTFGN